jgi:hypothetical protein
LLRDALSNMGQSSHGGEQQQQQQQQQVHTGLAVLAAAAASVAVAAAAYAVGRKQAAQRAMRAARPGAAVTAVYQTLDGSSALPVPQQAACIEAGLLGPLQQTGPPSRAGPGDHHGCPSRVIAIDTLGAASGSILEPLLRHQHMCRCAVLVNPHTQPD